MKTGFLWQISIDTSLEAEDALNLWLGDLFGTSAASYTDVETRSVMVSVCLNQRPEWTETVRRRLAGGIERVRECGLDVGKGSFALTRLARRSWAESWKRHFPPLEIGSALLLKPSWSRRRARKGQAVIVLDPGLSFGTVGIPRRPSVCGNWSRAHARGRRDHFSISAPVRAFWLSPLPNSATGRSEPSTLTLTRSARRGRTRCATG